jgi:hypothetical protein
MPLMLVVWLHTSNWQGVLTWAIVMARTIMPLMFVVWLHVRTSNWQGVLTWAIVTARIWSVVEVCLVDSIVMAPSIVS